MRFALHALVVFLCLMFPAFVWAQSHPSTAPENDPIQSLLALSDAVVRGDAASIRQRLDYHGTLATDLADATISFDLAQARLRTAAHKVFPDQDISTLVFGSPQTNRQQLASATQEVDGNKATIKVGDQAIIMVRVDGLWKRSVIAPVQDWPQSDVRHLIDEVRHQADIYNSLAVDVEHEKFHTPRQAAEELREQLLKPVTRPATKPATSDAS